MELRGGLLRAWGVRILGAVLGDLGKKNLGGGRVWVPELGYWGVGVWGAVGAWRCLGLVEELEGEL